MDAPSPRQNRLLAALPKNDYEALLPHLEPVFLEARRVLYEPHKPIFSVYFPLNCAGSLINYLQEDQAVEFATVGNEGIIGLPVILGARSIPTQAICQVPGHALRMDATRLQEFVWQGGPLSALLFRYVQALFNQVAQSAACNRAHPIEERCARWLLMTHDRVDRDTFPLTQEFLSFMLGVRRQTVTVAAGILSQAGLICYNRGIITIVDREGLEDASCECYRIIRDEFDKLIGVNILGVTHLSMN